MDFENYVETAKQTRRQMKMIKTLSWFTSLQSHTSAFESLIHMCNTDQEDQAGKNADIWGCSHELSHLSLWECNLWRQKLRG